MAEDEPYVVTFHNQAAWKNAALALVPVGAVLWSVFNPSPVSIAVGGFLLVCSVWLVAVILAGRRVRAGRPRELAVTREGLRTPGWSLAWDRVASVTVQERTGGLAVVIHPVRSSDVVRAPSRILALNAWTNDIFGQPQITLLQRVIDRPLEEVFQQLEAKSGRSFR